MYIGQENHGSPYINLFIMLVFHFIVMFAVMYTMVDSWENAVINLNQFYMTMMMVLPMTSGMLLFMASMYKNKKLNLLLHGISLILFIMFFYFMRAQTYIEDRQFLKSMIPHHAGAILMCQEARLSSPQIIELCGKIIESQEKEISEMKVLLENI